jgi:phospholipase C
MWERPEKSEISRRGLTVHDEARPHPELSPGTDLIPEIKHIVVLMMENHSYDNYLGLLDRGDGFTMAANGAPGTLRALRPLSPLGAGRRSARRS